MSGSCRGDGAATALGRSSVPQVFLHDDRFFDEDEVLDYIWYEKMRQEDEGPDPPSSGCFTLFLLLALPVSLLGSFFCAGP